MSLLVLHFRRNPASFFDKIDEFARVKECKQRFVGGKFRPARVLVHEWQVDLLDNLPLYLLESSHVVVADDWRAGLLQKLRSKDRRIKHEMTFFEACTYVAMYCTENGRERQKNYSQGDVAACDPVRTQSCTSL